jgi:hypothetical protein
MGEEQQVIGWAILELMGHRKVAGYVQEVEIAGRGLLRVDVPEAGGIQPATHYFAPDALYCLTPTIEEMVRRVATAIQPLPVNRWELQRQQAQIGPGDDEEAGVDGGEEDQEF